MASNIALLLATLLAQNGLLAQTPEPAILQIHVIEGEGAVYAAGSRSTRGVTVQITDETGKPVEGVTVSFRLPDEGPSGTFASGSRTEIATTRGDGKASAWGMQWNRTEGPFEIRITAMKGQARAGITCPESLSAAASRESSGAAHLTRRSGSHKWIWVAIGVAGAAGAGVAVRSMSGKSSLPTGPTTTPLSIGTPTISIGHP